jgi:hypothetical protein
MFCEIEKIGKMSILKTTFMKYWSFSGRKNKALDNSNVQKKRKQISSYSSVGNFHLILSKS